MQLFYDVLKDSKKALLELSRVDRFFHVLWLLGPFILLVERSPGDAYITSIAFAFIFRSLKKRDSVWLKPFWVKSAFAFWGVCLLSAAFSSSPSYALGEAFIWFRFPLFAIATVFWLSADKRLLNLMLISTAFALLLMCGILLSEIMIEGFKSRLSWPYDDLVPGNYLAKVGLPVVVFSVAYFLSSSGWKSILIGGYCLLIIGMTLMTGERINFLILFCAVLLTIFILEPSWKKRSFFFLAISLIPISLFYLLPTVLDRFFTSFLFQLPIHQGSPYYQAMAPAWLIFEKHPILGIGPGNFRYLCPDLVHSELGLQCHNHPHNFYFQILSETGLLGALFAVSFISSLVIKCFRSGVGQSHTLYAATWIIPFSLFWPLRSSADFFGQWNNIFLWNGLALALAVVYSKSMKH